MIFGTRDKNRTRKREFQWRAGVGFCSFGRSGCNTVSFSHQKGAIILGRQLFQILLTGSRTLNILFYYPIKSKNNHIQYTEHGLYKCSKFGPRLSFNVSTVSSISELESSQIIFAHFSFVCYPRWQFLTWQEKNKRKGEGRLFQIFPSQGGDYSREAINGGSNSRKSLIQIKS